MFDAAECSQEPGLVAVLLDWAKAFDRIKHDAMIKALARFGIPEPILSLISSIYRTRSFILRDPAGDSSARQQRAGIAQGCPLSPYLFVIVQTVMFFDIDRLYNEMGMNFEEPPYVVCNDVLYADDTMLVSASALKAQLLLDITI